MLGHARLESLSQVNGCAPGALDPNRITHRLDLAAVYADRDHKAKAVEQYEWIAGAPIVDFNDPSYKAEAARRLKALR